jgi:hypothetical protein
MKVPDGKEFYIGGTRYQAGQEISARHENEAKKLIEKLNKKPQAVQPRPEK